jgi:hypothetical protein
MAGKLWLKVWNISRLVSRSGWMMDSHPSLKLYDCSEKNYSTMTIISGSKSAVPSQYGIMAKTSARPCLCCLCEISGVPWGHRGTLEQKQKPNSKSSLFIERNANNEFASLKSINAHPP